MPGALTPTEIVRAWNAGADVVKVFPCSALEGELHPRPQAPLPQIDLIRPERVAEDHRRLHSGRLLRARSGRRPGGNLGCFARRAERAHRTGARNTSRPSRPPRLVEVDATNKRDAPAW